MQSQSRINSRMLITLFSLGLLVILFSVVAVNRVSEANRIAQRKAQIEKALIDKDFDLILELEPNHEEALVGRIRHRIGPPQTNLPGAVQDLETLKRISPEHPLHTEIQPALLVAEAVEHARRGRIDAAFKAMNHARDSGVKEPQLTVVKEALINVLVRQAQSHLRHQRYREAITDADKAVKLGGARDQVTPVLKKASDAVFERAMTPTQLEQAIVDLETVRSINDNDAIREQLGALHFRRAKLAYSSGLLDIAGTQFNKALDSGCRDSAAPRFAVEFAETVIAAYAAAPTERSRDRALDAVAILDELPIDVTSVIAVKLRLSTSLLSDLQSSRRNANIDYASQCLTLARSHKIDLAPHRSLTVLLAQAYADRCITRFQRKETQLGIDDFLAAKALNELQRLALLHRLELAGIPIPDELQPKEAEQTEFAETDSIWFRIPANAEAFFVVRDIERFSDESDLLARRLKIPEPAIFKTMCRSTGIGVGLRKDGNFGYMQLPVQANPSVNNRGTVWIVPTTNAVSLIKPIRSPGTKKEQVSGASLYTVEVNGSKGFMAPLDSYVLFAFEPDRNSLIAAAQSQFSIYGRLYPFNEWGADLDAYTVITPGGLKVGIRDFPIPDSVPILNEIVSRIRKYLPTDGQLASGPAENFVQWAIGLTIQPDKGIAVRSRSWTKPNVDLIELLSECKGGRERSLNLLPDVPFVTAIGGPVSARQCEALSALAAMMFPEQDQKPVVSLSRIQIALLMPDKPPINVNAAWRKTPMEEFARLQRSLVLAAEVEDAMISLADIKARFDAQALAGPAAPAGIVPRTESIVIDGTAVLRVHLNQDVDAPQLPGPLVMNVAAPNKTTLVITFGDDALVRQVMVPCRGGVSLAESAIVAEAVELLPESTSWVMVADLKPVMYEVLRPLLFGNAAMLEKEFKSLGIDEGRAVPVAIGMSWKQAELDIDLCIPNVSLPAIRSILSFL